MEDVARAAELTRVARQRTGQLIASLKGLDDAAMERPSRLPGWTRLTIVCHLRYGHRALLRMTIDTLAGRETAYYPEGRTRQRATTLVPRPGERSVDVVADWQSTGVELDGVWSTLDEGQWRTEIVEPADNPDLGEVPLARLALARLTELEVHATDLDIDAPDWSSTLVEVALPTRLAWLEKRRTNHRSFDRSIRGSWLLVAIDGPRWLVAVDDDRVVSRPATDGDDVRGSIEGTSRDLLALLLGRQRRDSLRLGGDISFARSFEQAFPGP